MNLSFLLLHLTGRNAIPVDHLEMGLLPRRDKRASPRMTFAISAKIDGPYGPSACARSPGAGARGLPSSALARQCDPTQAAVARQLSQLEEHFGARLFHRTARKLKLHGGASETDAARFGGRRRNQSRCRTTESATARAGMRWRST